MPILTPKKYSIYWIIIEIEMTTLDIKSEITGIVCKIIASIGDHLEESDTILFIESMKMEIPVLAPSPGKLRTIHVAEGGAISEDDVLATIEI